MELKDIIEIILEHAVESMVFLLFLTILWNLFFGGGMAELIHMLGISLFGG